MVSLSPSRKPKSAGKSPCFIFRGTHFILGCSIMMVDCRRVVTKAQKSVENVRGESSIGQVIGVKGGETG